MINCECLNWARIPTGNSRIDWAIHHINCEKFEPRKTWVYSVDGGETDWVIAKDEKSAEKIARQQGCNCDCEQDEIFIIKELSIPEMMHITYDDENDRKTYSLFDQLRKDDHTERLICSSVW
jgi:hypothetical protein